MSDTLERLEQACGVARDKLTAAIESYAQPQADEIELLSARWTIVVQERDRLCRAHEALGAAKEAAFRVVVGGHHSGNPAFGARECRGHWHVVTLPTGEDLIVAGDPFATEDGARQAVAALEQNPSATPTENPAIRAPAPVREER